MPCGKCLASLHQSENLHGIRRHLIVLIASRRNLHIFLLDSQVEFPEGEGEVGEGERWPFQEPLELLNINCCGCVNSLTFPQICK